MASSLESSVESSVVPKTVLRLKRRLDESPSPSKILVVSYKKVKFATNFDEIKSEEEINRVFHLAGTVDKDEIDDDKSISKTIKDALDIVEKNKSSLEKRNRSYKRRKSVNRPNEKAKEEVKQQALDNRFRVISQKRGIPPNLDDTDIGQEECYEPTLLFNLLDLVAEDEDEVSEKKASTEPRNIGSVTMNGIPMIRNDNDNSPEEADLKKSGFVFDLYVAKESIAEGHFENQFVSIRPGDYESGLFENCVSSDEELRPEDEDDSNDEDNWRNDYPDSDPDNQAEGFAYGYQQRDDDDMLEKFASFKLKGEELSSDDDGVNIYSTDYDGCDDGLGGMYTRYKSRLNNELADEVVSSESHSQSDDDED